MKKLKPLFIFFIILGTLRSCLVPPSPSYHYFVSSDNIKKDDPTLTIFSTPRHKNYVVTNIGMNAQIFIRSSIFGDPNEFYLMKNESFFEKEAKQYVLDKRDGRFYKTDDYKNITLKIISGENEKMINYKILEK